MTCYTVTTCVISDGSIPSDKGGGGGGEFIQTLSPEIRGGAGRSQKNLVKKKRLGGGGGETQALPQDPPLLYRYSGFVVKFDVPGSVGLDRSSPLSFFSLWLSVDFNGTQHAGKKTQMKKKLNRPFVFKCSIKVKLGRFALYSWNVGKEIFFTKKALCTYSVVVLLI